MAIAEEARQESVTTRKVEAKFLEFEEAYKAKKALFLNVYNIEESKDRLTRTIARNRRTLDELNRELDDNLNRVASNLQVKRPATEIKSEIRALEDEIEVKEELHGKTDNIVSEKRYGMKPDGVNERWYERNRERLAQCDTETFAGISYQVDTLREEFMQMLFERYCKKFRKDLEAIPELSEQLRLLISLSSEKDKAAAMAAILGESFPGLDVKTEGPDDILNFYTKGK